MSDVYLTKDGYEKLKEELAKLTDEKTEIAREVDETRSQGDLKENAGYHAAKEKQSMLFSRIHDLQVKLQHAKLVDDLAINKEQIRLGATADHRQWPIVRRQRLLQRKLKYLFQRSCHRRDRRIAHQ